MVGGINDIVLHFFIMKTGKISKPLLVQSLAEHFLFLNQNLKDISIKKTAILPCGDTIQTGCFALTNYKCVSVQYIYNSEKVILHWLTLENRKVCFLSFVSRYY